MTNDRDIPICKWREKAKIEYWEKIQDVLCQLNIRIVSALNALFEPHFLALTNAKLWSLDASNGQQFQTAFLADKDANATGPDGFPLFRNLKRGEWEFQSPASYGIKDWTPGKIRKVRLGSGTTQNYFWHANHPKPRWCQHPIAHCKTCDYAKKKSPGGAGSSGSGSRFRSKQAYTAAVSDSDTTPPSDDVASSDDFVIPEGLTLSPELVAKLEVQPATHDSRNVFGLLNGAVKKINKM